MTVETQTKLERDDPYNPSIATGTMPPKNNGGGGNGKGCGSIFLFLILIAITLILLHFFNQYMHLIHR